MNCAVYARKSTDELRDDENKSVHRQIANAKEYARNKGWEVSDKHVYMDDAISGAEYQNRPGMLRLLNNLKEFGAIIMSESSRFGRDMTRNSYYILEVIESGVRIFYYLADEEERADTPEQKLMISVKSYASEVERQKASQRSRDALEVKARRGFNTGGIVFGYDNVQVFSDLIDANGDKIKSHTDYKINSEQAGIIKGIFKMYIDGYGHTAICKTLNKTAKYKDMLTMYFDNLPLDPPRRGSGSWSPSVVREILYRERYNGIVPFGEYRYAYKCGTQVRIKQDAYIKTPRPDLMIIDDNLWNKVSSKLKTLKEEYQTSIAGVRRKQSGRTSRFLLSGLAQCGLCGGAIVVHGGTYGSGKNRRMVRMYSCSYHYKRGENVCKNSLIKPVKLIDEQFLTMLESTVLTPESFAYLYKKSIEGIKERLKDKTSDSAGQIKRFKKEQAKLNREISNFEEVIASGEANTTILEWMDKRTQRLKEVEGEINTISEAPDIFKLNLAKLEKEIHGLIKKKIQDFRGLLKRDVPAARKALKELLEGRIVFEIDSDQEQPTYKLKMRLKTGAIFDSQQVSNAGVPSKNILLENLVMPVEFVMRNA